MILEDSTTYQWILGLGKAEGRAEGKAEGKAEGAQDLILRLGSRHLGAPPPEAVAALRTVTDRDRLDRIAERVFNAASWDDLLATP